MSKETKTMQWVVSQLDAVKPRGDVVLAKCPAHDDDKASLSVTMGNKGVLLYCFAGCDLERICDRLGIGVTQLFYDYAEHGNWQQEADVDRLFHEMIKAYDPEYEKPPAFYGRVDEVMWEALVKTDKMPEVFWVRALGTAGATYPWLMSMTWPEAMQYRVVFRQGPLFVFLEPFWHVLGQPNLHKFLDYAMVKCRTVYSQNWALGGLDAKDKEVPE